MAFCPNCGTEAQGSFCAKCGTQISPAGGAQAGGSAPPPPPAAQSGLDENVASALCYILGILTGILFLVLEPYNRSKTIRFHAFQSIFAHIAFFAGWIVAVMLGFVPFVGWIITLGYWLVILVVWITLMVKAYNRQRWVLPVIGPLAEKQA